MLQPGKQIRRRGQRAVRALLPLLAALVDPHPRALASRTHRGHPSSQQHWRYSRGQEPPPSPGPGDLWVPRGTLLSLPHTCPPGTPPCSLRSSAMGGSLLAARRSPGHQPRFKVGKHTPSPGQARLMLHACPQREGSWRAGALCSRVRAGGSSSDNGFRTLDLTRLHCANT